MWYYVRPCPPPKPPTDVYALGHHATKYWNEILISFGDGLLTFLTFFSHAEITLGLHYLHTMCRHYRLSFCITGPSTLASDTIFSSLISNSILISAWYAQLLSRFDDHFILWLFIDYIYEQVLSVKGRLASSILRHIEFPATVTAHKSTFAMPLLID